jgi:hypothetical protein
VASLEDASGDLDLMEQQSSTDEEAQTRELELATPARATTIPL